MISALEWAARIRAGDVRSTARAATELENGGTQAASLLRELPSTGALTVGITGPPGVGKSTLVDGLCRALRAQRKRVAILAVDPSSSVTGGALLGDRIRMMSHFQDPEVFIRSMASRGTLGGLARTTRNVARLLDGAGFDVVVIETVGAGQSDAAIASFADVVVVVLAPGVGDDIQASKAGILEIADIFAVNRADMEGADALVDQLHQERPTTPAVKTVATDGRGVEQLLGAILQIRSRINRPAAQDFQIDHIGIAVPELDRALQFWGKLLGMECLARETVAQERVNVAMLDCSPSRVELLEAADGESTIAKYIAKRGPGIHHLALRVTDFEGALERLRAAGAHLLNEPRQGAGGHTYVFVHPASTGGVLLELIEN